MKTAPEQIKELEAMIATAKEPNGLLVKNWKRSINILNEKKHGIHNQNNDTSFQRESKQTDDSRTFD